MTLLKYSSHLYVQNSCIGIASLYVYNIVLDVVLFDVIQDWEAMFNIADSGGKKYLDTEDIVNFNKAFFSRFPRIGKNAAGIMLHK